LYLNKIITQVKIDKNLTSCIICALYILFYIPYLGFLEFYIQFIKITSYKLMFLKISNSLQLFVVVRLFLDGNYREFLWLCQGVTLCSGLNFWIRGFCSFYYFL